MTTASEFLTVHRTAVQLAWIDATQMSLPAEVLARFEELDDALGRLAGEPAWTLTRGGLRLGVIRAPSEAEALQLAGELWPGDQLQLKAERIQE